MARQNACPVGAQTIKTHSALLGSTVCFCGLYVASKIATNFAHPMTFLAMRCIPTSIVFFAAAYFWQTKRNLRAFLPVERKERVRLALNAVGFFSSFIAFQHAINFASAHYCSLFAPLTPCVATVISIVFKIEQFAVLKIAGMAVAAFGAFVVATQNEIQQVLGLGGRDLPSEEARSQLVASLLMLLNNFTFGFYVAQQKVTLRYVPLTVICFWCFFTGAVISGIWSLCVSNPVPMAEWNYEPWVAALYCFFFASVVAYVLSTYATAHTLPTVAGSYITLQPPGATLLAVLLLHEHLEIFTLVGGAFVVIGIGLVLYAKYREGKKLAAPSRPDVEMNAAGSQSGGSDDDLGLLSHQNGKVSAVVLSDEPTLGSPDPDKRLSLSNGRTLGDPVPEKRLSLAAGDHTVEQPSLSVQGDDAVEEPRSLDVGGEPAADKRLSVASRSLVDQLPDGNVLGVTGKRQSLTLTTEKPSSLSVTDKRQSFHGTDQRQSLGNSRSLGELHRTATHGRTRASSHGRTRANSHGRSGASSERSNGSRSAGSRAGRGRRASGALGGGGGGGSGRSRDHDDEASAGGDEVDVELKEADDSQTRGSYGRLSGGGESGASAAASGAGGAVVGIAGEDPEAAAVVSELSGV